MRADLDRATCALTAATLVLAALAMSGCDLGVRVPAPPDCRSDFDCNLDAVCTVGACVRVARTQAYDLALTPPNDSAFPKQQVTGVRVAPTLNEVPDIFLRAAVTFSGRALQEGSRDTTGLRARIEASRRGDIAGTSVRASALTVAEAGTGRNVFRLALTAGVYDVSIFPESSELPPVLWTSRVDLSASLERDLVLPAQSAFRRIAGLVVRSETTRTPVAGVHVQAFTASGAPASTVAKTFADGRFSLLALPGDATYSVRVSSTPDGPKIPTVEKAGLVVAAPSVDAGLIALGVYAEPLAVTGTVHGRTENGDLPVGRANVQLSGPVGNGTWVEQVTTTANGEFHAELPPGRYDVEIRPPIDGDFAFLTGALVLSTSGPHEWRLERKAVLSGQVLDPAGKPVSGVSVQAARIGALGSVSSDSVRYEQSASTDGAGMYSLRLDPGVFDLTFSPEGRPLARSRLSGVAIQGDAVRQDHRLPDGVVLAGVLREVGGRAFPGVTVEVFESSADATAPLLGSGVTDGDGWYRVVVPAVTTTVAPLAAVGQPPRPAP